MKNKTWGYLLILFLLGIIAWTLAVYAKSYAYKNILLWKGLAIIAIISWIIVFIAGLIQVRKKK